MNYKLIHDAIIKNAKDQLRNKTYGIFELHHIIPRSFGGTDEPSNLVLLTPKEHFIIHVLLWKINPCKKTNDPILFFKHKGASNSRLYQKAREFHINEMKNNNPSKFLSEESKTSKSNKLKEYSSNRPKEHLLKISQSRKGKPTRTGAVLENEQKEKISSSLKQYYAENEVSLETREKLRQNWLGRHHTDDSILKMQQTAKNRKKYSCPHCSKLFDGGNLALHMRKHGYDEAEIQRAKQ